MIELHIAHTCRRAGRYAEWTYTADTRERFPTIRDAWRWCHASLGTRYVPMYRDKKDGTTVRCGRVYSAKEHEAGTTYYRQYWVSPSTVTPLEEGT